MGGIDRERATEHAWAVEALPASVVAVTAAFQRSLVRLALSRGEHWWSPVEIQVL